MENFEARYENKFIGGIKMKEHTFKFELGVEGKSNISGYKGLLTSRAQHVNGCDRYWLVPKVGKDGKMQDGYWFDEGEIIIISKKKISRQNNNRGGFPSIIK